MRIEQWLMLGLTLWNGIGAVRTGAWWQAGYWLCALGLSLCVMKGLTK